MSSSARGLGFLWVLSVLLLLVGCKRAPNAGTDGGTTDSGTDAGVADAGPTDAGVLQEPAVEIGDGIERDTATLGGVLVDLYTWTDSLGKPRTVALKRWDGTSGGYAIKMTYQVPNGADWRTVTADGQGGGELGFGFFVAHERYRNFDDASQGTIAALHGEDDSPLGLNFSCTGSHTTIFAASTSVSHTFVTSYPKWGTTVAQADVDGTTPHAASAHQKFILPLQIRWTFQKNTDFPRIDFKLDLSAATAGQLAFDVRGPYGTVEFADADVNATLNNVQWGDSAYQFTTQASAAGDLMTGANWVWSEPIATVRPYHGLLARHSTTNVLYEIGLVELKLGTDPGLVYGDYSDNRGTDETLHGYQLLSAQFTGSEWPFQSAQYAGLSASLPANNKKFAWGSSSLYGSANTTDYLNATTPETIVGYPASGALIYRTCLVLGVSPFTDGIRIGLARTVAQSAEPSCATDLPLD